MSKEETKIPAFIQEFTDIKSEDPEEFKTRFKEEYAPIKQLPTLILKKEFEEVRSAVYGKRFGEATTKIIKAFKDAGFEISGDEVKGKEIEEVAKFFATKANEKITELETATKNNPTADEFKEKEGTYKQRIKELSEQNKAATLQIEKLSLDKDEAVKTVKKTFKIDEFKKKAEFSPDADNLKIRGFWSVFDETYNLETEEDELIVTDKKGAKIPHPKVASKFLSAEELRKIEIEKAGLAKINQDGGTPVKKETTTTIKPEDKKPIRKINTANMSFI